MTRSASPNRPDGPHDSQPQKHQRLDAYLRRAPPDASLGEVIEAFKSDKSPREVWPDG